MDNELEMYKIFVDDASDYIAIVDAPSTKILYINKALKKVYGLNKDATAKDYQHLNIFETHKNEDDKKKIRESFQILTDTKKQIKLELTFDFPKKSFFGEVLAKSKIYRGKKLVFAIIRDLSEIKKLNDDLLQKNTQLEAVSKHARVGLFEQSPEGEIYNDNDYAKTLFNSSNDPNRGKENNWQNYIIPEDLKRLMELRKYSLTHKKGVKFDFQGVRPDKTTFWGNMETTPHYDKKGNLLGFVGSVIDLTREKNREKELEKIIAHYEIVQRDAKIGIWEFDVKTASTYWSKEHFEIFNRKEKKSPTFEEFKRYLTSEGIKNSEKKLQSVIQEKKPYTWVFYTKHNSKWILSTGTPRLDDKGEVTSIMGTSHDITEVKKKEEELTIALTRLERVQRNAKIGVWEFDLITGEIYWSKELFELFGRSEKTPPTYEEFLSYIEKQHSKKHADIVQKCLKDHKPYSIEYPLKNGSKWLLGKGSAVTDKKGNVQKLLGTAIDISDIKKREEELNKTNTQLSNIMRLVPFGVFEHDLNDNLIYTNQKNISLLEEPNPSMKNIAPFILNNTIIKKKRESQLQGKSKEPQEFLLQYKKSKLKHLKVIKTPLLNERGEISSYLGTSIDITDAQTLNDLKEELEKTARAALIGEAATGIAHELNQPLASISSSADLLIRKIRAHYTKIPEDMEKNLRRLEEDTINAGNLVHSIKNLYTKKTIALDLIDIEHHMQEIQIIESNNSSSSSSSSSNSISYAITKELRKKEFYFSPTYLTLIFNNLVDNSKEASIDNSKNLKINFKWSFKGTFICLDYTDNGPGISPEVKDKIFQHFFSTKKSGTGIGLSLIYTLLEFYHGSIKIVDSKKGAHFQILFPLEAKQFRKQIK